MWGCHQIDLHIREGVVEDARFSGHGCAISQASADLLLDRIKGQPLEVIQSLTREDVFEELGVETLTVSREVRDARSQSAQGGILWDGDSLQTVMSWLVLCRKADIPPGQARAVELEDMYVAVYNVDGQFFATDDTCSHEEASLADGFLEGELIECPLHGSQFNVKTGEVLTPPAIMPVRTFPTKLEGDNILIELDSPCRRRRRLLINAEEHMTTEQIKPSEELVLEALKEVHDPEIGINIVDLGLIYGTDIDDLGKVSITMTLTTPACPLNEYIPRESGAKASIPLLDAAVGSASPSRERIQVSMNCMAV